MENNEERNIWTGHPSHILSFGTYVLCAFLFVGGIVLAVVLKDWLQTTSISTYAWYALAFFLVALLLVILWTWLVIQNTIYEVTTQRIKVNTGVLNKETQELELYRVRDYQIRQSIWQRLFAVGDIEISSSDQVMPDVVLKSIPNHQAIREKMRTAVEEIRLRKGVRALEV